MRLRTPRRLAVWVVPCSLGDSQSGRLEGGFGCCPVDEGHGRARRESWAATADGPLRRAPWSRDPKSSSEGRGLALRAEAARAGAGGVALHLTGAESLLSSFSPQFGAPGWTDCPQPSHPADAASTLPCTSQRPQASNLQGAGASDLVEDKGNACPGQWVLRPAAETAWGRHASAVGAWESSRLEGLRPEGEG